MESMKNEVTAYCELIQTSLANFVKASEALGKPVADMAYKAKRAFDAQYGFIQAATMMKTAPNPKEFTEMLIPLTDVVFDMVNFCRKNKGLPNARFFNHLQLVADMIQALRWTPEKSPAKFIEGILQTYTLLGNEILSNNKREAADVDWLNKFHKVLNDLLEYVKNYHRTGFSWGAGVKRNQKGDKPPPNTFMTIISYSVNADEAKELNSSAEITNDEAPPRPPLPNSEENPSPRPPPPETDDEFEAHFPVIQPNQPIMVAAHGFHQEVKQWSSKDNKIISAAKKMALLMAKLSQLVSCDSESQTELIACAEKIAETSKEITCLAKEVAGLCTDKRMRTNILQVCERLPIIGTRLRILSTVKATLLDGQGTNDDLETTEKLAIIAQNLMEVVKETLHACLAASVKV